MTDILLAIYEYRWFLGGVSFICIATGVIGIIWKRNELTLGPVPRKLAEPPAPTSIGPVCPICGGPFHPVCPSAKNEERTEEVAESALRTRPYLPEWPQFGPGLEPTVVLRQLPGPTPQETDHLAARHAAPEPECPLTTDTIRIDIDAPTPIHDAAVRGDTVDLSAKTQKIKAVAS